MLCFGGVRMKKNMALKIRIYPNKNQMILLNKNFGCVRYMYNGLLSLYKEKGKVVSYKEVYNDENDWLLDADTSSYSNVQINLNIIKIKAILQVLLTIIQGLLIISILEYLK